MAAGSVMTLCSRCERLHRPHDVVVTGASADVAGKVVADIVFCRSRMLLEQLPHAHDHSWRAESALKRVVFVKGGLDWMQVTHRWRWTPEIGREAWRERVG